MAKPLPKRPFLADLLDHIGRHYRAVEREFAPLGDAQLTWRPAPGEWSVLQCLDHLSMTHAYYRLRIEAALARPRAARPDDDRYRPSFWGGIYMHFALNPQSSYPVSAEMAPGDEPDRAAIGAYLQKQRELVQLIDRSVGVDLRRTPVRIERGVGFNLGDCLKILAYHDALHMRQAREVLRAGGF